MKTNIAPISVLATLFAASTLAYSAVVLDQSFTDPPGVGLDYADLVGLGPLARAQTFTAGLDGTLVSVNLDLDAFDKDVPIRVAIYNTKDSMPGDLLLGEVTVPGPVHSEALITFPTPVPIASGNQYAITVNQPQTVNGAEFWQGLFGPTDLYPGGEAWYLTITNFNQGPVWVSFYDGYYLDLHFRTFVEPLPISELVPCAGPPEGGSWKNHGEYVAAVRRAVERYEQVGVLTREEASRTLTAAANSNCGKK